MKNNIHFGEDDSIIYPAGHTVVLFNPQTKTQRFLFGSDVNDPRFEKAEITALAVSPNRRFCAIAERAREFATISVYDLRTLKKRKVLVTTELRCTEYVSLCFSPDSKYLLSLGSGPDTPLINWLWHKARPVHLERVDVRDSLTACSFCPADPTLLCLSGPRALLYYEADPGATHLRPVLASLAGAPQDDYTCHAWGDGKRTLVGTNRGQVRLYSFTKSKHLLLTLISNNLQRDLIFEISIL